MRTAYLSDLAQEIGNSDFDRREWLTEQGITYLAFLRFVEDMSAALPEATRALGAVDALAGVIGMAFNVGWEARGRLEQP